MAKVRIKRYPDKKFKGWQVELINGKSILFSASKYKKNDVDKRVAIIRDAEADLTQLGQISERTESDLRRFPDLRSALIEKGVVQSAPIITLGELFKRYLDDCKVAESTLGNRRNALRRALDLIGDRIALDVDEQVANSFDALLNNLVEARKRNDREGISEATRAGYIKQIKTAFNWAVKKKLLPANPFNGIKAGSQINHSRQEYITPKESALILDACQWSPNSAEWRALFALARFQGLRIPSESRALRWQDVDFDRKTISVYSQKTARYKDKDRRIMPLFPDTARILKELRDEQRLGKGDFVFQRLRGDNLRTTFEKIIYRAGVERYPKLFQNLRASAATDVERRFGGVAESRWLGHVEKVAQDHYFQITDETLERAKEFTFVE